MAGGGSDEVLGLLACLVAIVGFGSNFVVTKKYDMKDGMFFQWIMCSAVFMVGFFVYLARGTPQFEPFAMLGGMLWCLGNVWVVSIVKAIGLALGLLVWGLTNMVAGWASGRFGILGVEKEGLSNSTLNTVGVAVAIASLMLYSQVRPSTLDDAPVGDTQPLLKPDEEEGEGVYRHTSVGHVDDSRHRHPINSTDKRPASLSDAGSGTSSAAPAGTSFVDRMNRKQKIVFGLSMSLISGLFYGVNFNPPQYVKAHRDHKYPGAPDDLIDYVFPHFTGIFLTSTFVFLAYAVYNRSRPVVMPEIVLPSALSGVIWAVAQTSWFIANQKLSMLVAFPLICMCPGLVGAIWGIFLYGEIAGKRNYIFLGFAFVVAAAASVMIVVSGKH